MESKAASIGVGVTEEAKRHSLLADLFIRLVREKPLGTVGAVIVLIAFLVGIFANLIAPYGMNEQNLSVRLQGPTAQYLLGTDGLGRDLLSRIIYGARISMIVGLAATSMGTVLSTIIGLLSGFLGGKFDIVVQRLVDSWMCFPAIFLILTVMAVVGQGLWQVILVIGGLYGITNSRVVRSAVIGIKENIYVEAASAVGCSTARTLSRHILPNVMAPIIILFTVNMGSAILLEATISFLGFGIPPPQPSWGGMLSGPGRAYMLQNPWMAIWPGLALGIVVYGVNMLGDALRDILDPRLRGGLGRYGGAKVKKATRRSQLSSAQSKKV
jgi:peptide/nickel transport system permease protein